MQEETQLFDNPEPETQQPQQAPQSQPQPQSQPVQPPYPQPQQPQILQQQQQQQQWQTQQQMPPQPQQAQSPQMMQQTLPQPLPPRALTYTPSTIAHILNELRKVVVGQDEVIEQILVAVLAEGHALLEGVPGTAKTLTVKTLARIIGAQFSRIQFTPDLMPSDITGTNVFNVRTSEFNLRQGPIFTDILLADEINRTPPKTQSALLEAMEERQTTIDGERHPLSPLFTVLATENPIEYEGTYPLPEAQLDRFLLKILIDYPPADAEQEIVARWDAGFNSRHLEQIEILPLGDVTAIQHCRREVKQMRTEPGVQKYIVEIVQRTRNHPAILYGASPRASVALLLCSKALAAIRGREFPTPDDVRDVALPVLRHRLSLRAEAELDGATTDAVISDIIKTVEVPR